MQSKTEYWLKTLLYFFTFSFAGWLMETAYGYCELGYFIKRGFLYGPICPIYGFGAIILMLCLKKYQKHSFKLFIYSAVVFSVFEYIVGFCLDAIFASKWWDYSTEFLNLNGRISILFSFAWGIIAILFINHLLPFIDKKIDKIWTKFSVHYKKLFISILTVIFVTDIVFSFIKYLK